MSRSMFLTGMGLVIWLMLCNLYRVASRQNMEESENDREQCKSKQRKKTHQQIQKKELETVWYEKCDMSGKL